MYSIYFSKTAIQEVAQFEKTEPQVFKKIEKLLLELAVHPTTGTGHPKPLSGNRKGQWSRRITQKHRLIYLIEETQITVLVLSAYGNYDDK